MLKRNPRVPARRLFTLGVASLLLSLSAGIASPPARAADEAPRAGKYKIYTFGAPGNPPIYLGWFTLGNGTYEAHLPGDKLQGSGAYAYDASTHNVTWKSGPYAGQWGGAFTVEAGGKRHKIRMKSNTVATNDG